MTDRSYAQIRWQNDRLGLLVVNTSNERFFIHAEKLQELFNRQEEYTVVKQRDRKPSRAIGYYAGQVYGTLDQEGEEYQVTLYIGNPYEDIGFDMKACLPKGYLLVQKYTFPKAELARFKRVMADMLEQKQDFDNALSAAEATPLKLYRKER